MDSGIASLHKILKDKTREQIVRLLNDKGPLAYTELMETMGIHSTGSLNYHLKVLSDLIDKNENSQYILSDKGKLAARLLEEFPNGQPSGKPKWWRSFWIQTAIAIPIMVALTLVTFFTGHSSTQGLYQGLVSIIYLIGFAYMLQHILRDVLSNEKKLLVAKFGYVAGGISLGLFIGYFGSGFALVGISRSLGVGFHPGNPLYSFFWSTPFQIFGLLFAPMIGATFMYQFGKKRRFKTKNYNPDTLEKELETSRIVLPRVNS
jgi:hypothetical protein